MTLIIIAVIYICVRFVFFKSSNSGLVVVLLLKSLLPQRREYSVRKQCHWKTIYVNNTDISNCIKDLQLYDFVVLLFNSRYSSWGVHLTIKYTK